jgi:hypothetical protein
MIHNRVQRDIFALRQEFIAQMLGVHRPSVSVAANMLQKAGLISYTRGQMEIVDAAGLEEGACDCYQLIEKEASRCSATLAATRGRPIAVHRPKKHATCLRATERRRSQPAQ